MHVAGRQAARRNAMAGVQLAGWPGPGLAVAESVGEAAAWIGLDTPLRKNGGTNGRLPPVLLVCRESEGEGVLQRPRSRSVGVSAAGRAGAARAIV